MPHQALTSSYTHTQADVSSVWTITHNITQAREAPVVDCWTMHNGIMTNILPISTTTIDSNTVVVVFSTERSGYAAVV